MYVLEKRKGCSGLESDGAVARGGIGLSRVALAACLLACLPAFAWLPACLLLLAAEGCGGVCVRMDGMDGGCEWRDAAVEVVRVRGEGGLGLGLGLVWVWV